MKRKYKKESNRNFGAEKYSNCNENTYYRGLGIDLNRKKKESVSLKICQIKLTSFSSRKKKKKERGKMNRA